MQQYLAIAGATLLPNVGGFIASFFMRDSLKNWYVKLKKPSFNPPNWVFGPVWTTLYTSIGFASYLVYRDGGGFNGAAQTPLLSYGCNLILNWLWSPIFFNWNKLDLALIEILILDASTLTTGYMFYQINKSAGYLFIPYGMWLTLATALSYRYYMDNPKIESAKITEVKDN